MSGEAAPFRSQIEPDHLVVAARTLDEGVAWCEATLGVVPGAGGKHPTDGDAQPPARAELGALSADVSRDHRDRSDAPSPSRARWFDLDAPALQQAIAGSPRLVHWVARTGDIDASLLALRAAGYELGAAVAAERMTPRGLLRWRIALRDDGRRRAAGAVPLLIEWGDVHPCDALPESGVSVERIAIGGVAGPSPQRSAWSAALAGVGAAPAERRLASNCRRAARPRRALGCGGDALAA